MATEADLIQKFKDLNIPVGADFEELIHEAFAGANLVDKVDNHDSRIATVEDNLDAMKGSIQSNTDKLATKADDSKVVHSTVTQLNSTNMNNVKTAGFYALNSGTNGMPNADAWTIYQVIPLSWQNGVQVAYGTNSAILGIRSWNGTINFTSWVQFADDSKVAHLSGANNFDTVPTVNNNPLLLAGSLPSDIARTTKDTNFTGKLQKSGNDVATKSDVTTAISTATANMVDSSKPTNFTAGLQSGGVDVATAADIKSIKDSAWRVLDFKNIVNDHGVTPSIDNTSVFLYKLDETNKRIYMLFTLFGTFPASSNLYFNFSNVVKNISFPTFENYGFHISIPGVTASDIKNNKLHISIAGDPVGDIVSVQSEYFDSGWHYFPCFVTYDELV